MRSISRVSNAATILLLSFWISNYSSRRSRAASEWRRRMLFPRQRKLQRRFVSTSKTNACVAALMSVADSFLPAGEIRGSE